MQDDELLPEATGDGSGTGLSTDMELSNGCRVLVKHNLKLISTTYSKFVKMGAMTWPTRWAC